MNKSRRTFLKNLTVGALGLTALSLAAPIAHAAPTDFQTFMTFSSLMTEQTTLSPEFGQLCWRYVQAHATPAQLALIKQYVAEPSARASLMETNTDLQSISYHTLAVWYKGDIRAIDPTPDEVKLAYLNALIWATIGRPPRGICVPNWSTTCTTS